MQRSDLLGHFRRLFATFTIIVAVLLIIQIPNADVPTSARFLAAAAAGGVIVWSLLLWRTRLPLLVGDILLITMVATVAIALGSQLWIYSLVYVSLYQRALEGTRARAFAAAIALFVTWEVLARVLTPGESSLAGDGAMLIGVLFSAWLQQTIRALVEDHDRTVRRERVLTRASGRLLHADEPREVAEIAVQAGVELPLAGEASCSLWRRDGDDLVKLAVVNPGPGDLQRVPLSLLPEDVRAAYDRGEPYQLVAESSRRTQRQVGGASPYETLLVVPTTRSGEVTGALLITCTVATDEGLLDVLGRFADTVSLAEERVELAQALSEREARFATVVANSSDVIMMIDPAGTILFVNEAVRASFGLDAADLVGRDVVSLLIDDDVEAVRARFEEWPGREHVRFDCRLHGADGEIYDVEVTANLLVEADAPRYVVNVRDVTERRQMEAELSFRAFHDTVTGLANRSLFSQRASHALSAASRSGDAIAVALIDLDDFKSVNDSLGHEAGDRLLVTVGERLRQTLRANDTAARLGGDEFAVLLDGVADAADAMLVLERVREALGQPIALAGRELPVHASIGVCLAQPGQTSDDLLRDADAAMYVAKNRGKHRVELFRPEMHATVLRRLELRSELEHALSRGEFELYYQPLVDLPTGDAVSLEALLRWHHPERGLIGPDEFIPIAEESGVIVELGRWVLQSACRTVSGLAHTGIGLSVNVSARQLQEPGLPADVAAALRDAGLPAERLMVEVTETAMLEDPVVAGHTLALIRELGVRVAVDDFGTGHSSLLHLQHLPIDVVKVDRVFVQEAGRGVAGARLVRAIEQLARVLQLEVVAEGIETEEQAQALRSLGYAVGQGFLYARPMPLPELERWLPAVAERSARALA